MTNQQNNQQQRCNHDYILRQDVQQGTSFYDYEQNKIMYQWFYICTNCHRNMIIYNNIQATDITITKFQNYIKQPSLEQFQNAFKEYAIEFPDYYKYSDAGIIALYNHFVNNNFMITDDDNIDCNLFYHYWEEITLDYIMIADDDILIYVHDYTWIIFRG